MNPAPAAPAYTSILRLVRSHAGLVFSGHRLDETTSLIRKAMSKAGARSESDYLTALLSTPGELDSLIDKLTIGETYFFRHPAQFDLIRSEVLSRFRESRCRSRQIQAWVAGCASGEEAYSLAILLSEEGLGNRSRVLATDLSHTALKKAEKAEYGTWSLRGCSPAFRQRYFVATGNRFRLDPRIREAVTFLWSNLAAERTSPPGVGGGGMDLILCRNVLIYFDAETIHRVAKLLRDSLSSEGWLVTAPADPALQQHASLEAFTTPAGVVYRRSGKETRTGHLTKGLDSARVHRRGPGEAKLPSRTRGTSLARPAASRRPGFQTERRCSRESASTGLSDRTDSLERARELLTAGDFAGVLRLTSACDGDEVACQLRVRALAESTGVAAAQQSCEEAIALHPLSAPLHVLQATYLMDAGREDEAEAALERAIYLDSSLAFAHFTLGAIRWRRGDLAGARRAFRNATQLCETRPPDEAIELAGDENVETLSRAAADHLALIDKLQEQEL